MEIRLKQKILGIERHDEYEPTHRTGYLKGTSYAGVVQTLGFMPNVEDDVDKVKYSWLFKVDGKVAAIWDYKGSASMGHWSVYDPHHVLGALFSEEKLHG